MLATGAWMAATAAATVVSWTGVGVVSRAVTSAPEPVLPAARIVDAVNASPVLSENPAQSAQSGAPSTKGSLTTGQAHPVAHVATPTQGTSANQTTTTTTAPKGAAGGTSSSGAVTFTSTGGQATVECQADDITLLSASPSNGFQLSVQSSGPVRVELTFTGTPNVYLVLGCQDGRPVRIDQLTSPPSGGPGPQTGSGGGSGGPGASGGGGPGTGSGSGGNGGSGTDGGSPSGGSPGAPSDGSGSGQGSSH
jgi:hypothetical protein